MYQDKPHRFPTGLNDVGWEQELQAAHTHVMASSGDQTRWAILARLGQGAASATTLADGLPVSRQAIAKHLVVLRETGLVVAGSGGLGREVRHHLRGTRLSEVGRDLERIGQEWERRLARIKALAEVAEE